MSSDVLVLGAMVVTGVAVTWWSLIPVGPEAGDNARSDDDGFNGDGD
jgi:hypothetical protein